MSEQLAYTISQALERVPIGRSKFYELISSGAVRSIKIGDRRLIPADALAELVETGAA